MFWASGFAEGRREGEGRGLMRCKGHGYMCRVSEFCASVCGGVTYGVGERWGICWLMMERYSGCG